jgi:spore germination protein YaaH
LKTGIGILLFTVTVLSQNVVKAQNKSDSDSTKIEIEPATILLDSTLSFKNDSLNLIKKIIQPFKFRDNRNRKEMNRVYQFMLGLVKKGELNIDSATVDDIMLQLDTITSLNQLNTQSIDTIIARNDLYKKASKVVIDSIKIQMGAIVKQVEDNNKLENEKPEPQNINRDYLQQLKDVQYANSTQSLQPDSLNQGNDLNYIDVTLKPRINIVGWYTTNNQNEYLNYNYNYLSVINLNGYELTPGGKMGNPKTIREFEKTGGIIEYATQKNCPVHLTVFSKNSGIISRFLNDSIAQQTLVDELNSLINKDNLKGINIYFDGIQNTNRNLFTGFVKKLRQNLNKDSVKLNLTIPAVRNNRSLSEISAYNFSALNSFVDYYMVLTDNLTSLYNKKALIYSPLYNSDGYGQRTIESTINFYSNGKIPLSKLMVTLSYMGIEWPVDDFLGTVTANMTGRPIKYNSIINNYKNTQVAGRTVQAGFDTIQVAAYLNVSDLPTYKNGKISRKQVWFENSNSLFQKYNWILNNNLGGVAIRGIGYDNGYSELWDVLGTTLVKIDTVFYNVETLQEICPCIYDSIENLSNQLKISNWKELWKNYKDYKKANSDSTSWIIFRNDYNMAKEPNLEYFNTSITPNKKVLASKKDCVGLITRWYIYAYILFGIAVFFWLAARLVIMRRNYLERHNPGINKNTFIKIAPMFFTLAGLIFMLLGVYFEPKFDRIGAGNEGISDFWFFVLAVIVGLILGVLLIFWRMREKNKYKNKNQP